MTAGAVILFFTLLKHAARTGIVGGSINTYNWFEWMMLTGAAIFLWTSIEFKSEKQLLIDQAIEDSELYKVEEPSILKK